MSSFRSALFHSLSTHKNKTALIYHGVSYSFNDIARQALPIARYVSSLINSQDAKSQRQPVVAVAMERNPNCFATIIGIMLGGGIYLPVEKNLPRNRIQYLLDESRPLLLFVDDKAGDIADIAGPSKVHLPQEIMQGGLRDSLAIECSFNTRIPLYLLFTSGSSGNPKAVLGTEKGLLNRIQWQTRCYPYQPGEVACQRSSLGFVDSICEIFAPFLNGLTNVIVPADSVADFDYLATLVTGYRVTRLLMVPSLLRLFLQNERLHCVFDHLDYCVVSGEPLPKSLAHLFLSIAPRTRLINIYGSSEVSADVSSHEVTAQDFAYPSIPIGTPLDNVDIRIFDEKQKEVKDGGKGEIYIFSDAAVADGYLNGDYGNEKFSLNYFCTNAKHQRVYRTGDQGYFHEGILFYAGRLDLTYKMAGKKICPYEIEQYVEGLTVGIRKLGGNEKLVGYFQTQDNAQKPQNQIEHIYHTLSLNLPEYMVPTLYCFPKEMPLKTNGKVDRQSLPTLDDLLHCWCPVVNRPENKVEQQIAAIFSQFIGTEQVDVEMDFFKSGGRSVEVPMLVSRLNRFFARQITLADFYGNRSVRSLSALLQNLHGSSKSVFHISSAAAGTPVFIVHPAGGLAFSYRTLAEELPYAPLFGLNAPDFGKSNKNYDSVESLAQLYVRDIAPYHRGQVILSGWSFGGEVAYELARQLESAGITVVGLILIDTPKLCEKSPDSCPDLRSQYFLKNGLDPQSLLAQQMVNEMDFHGGLSINYQPRALACENVVLLKATQSGIGDRYNGWKNFCDCDIKVIPIEGEHDYLFDQWHLKSTAEGMRAALNYCESRQVEEARRVEVVA